jgi:hypothetical protein
MLDALSMLVHVPRCPGGRSFRAYEMVTTNPARGRGALGGEGGTAGELVVFD